ncbi:ATP-grasp domain-containing protein, partial [Bacteroidota bacterium]
MKKNIALISGGNSSEIEISVQSAEQVQNWIDDTEFDSYLIVIEGKKWICIYEGKEIPVNKSDFSIITLNTIIQFDCALIMIHGTPGEDGKLQAYFDLMNIPYTTSGVLASSLSFNKYACKLYLNQVGIKTAKSILIRKNDIFQEDELIRELGLPCFVKPNEGGSSFGVTKVRDRKELNEAVKHAQSESEDVLIEEYIQGTEITCGMFKSTRQQYIFPITEIVSKTDFFDYKAKYIPGHS